MRVLDEDQRVPDLPALPLPDELALQRPHLAELARPEIEEALIRAIRRFGITGERKEGWTGVWTGGGARKLASIGVAVKRWVTLHGFALNVSTDLGRFASINPCGLEATTMGSMESVLGRPVPFAEVKAATREELGAVFARLLV